MESLLLSLASVIVLGTLSQWVAWRIGVPSILLLLIVGFLAGPVTGLLDPDALLGDLLFPVVSLSVAIILFEGGLSLRFSEVRKVGRVVFNLISIGCLISWLVLTWAAHAFLDLDFALCTLLGALLTVSGPTVVLPLLRHVRPKPPLSSVLKWEGILIDPVGAVLAVLVFETIISETFHRAPIAVLQGIAVTALVGGGLGLIAGLIMAVLLKRDWIPDYLQNPVALAALFVFFVLANHLHPESGLLAVTVMGMVLANWSSVAVKHILEFKENLRVLLISSLFILLAARVRVEDVTALGWGAPLFLLSAIFIARPIAVLGSTLRTGLSWSERLFLCWVAPRGIVAAAVASLFSLELLRAGVPDAEALVAYTFLVIVGTVTIYGLSARPVARLLGVEESQPQGLLIVGADRFGRGLAQAVQKQGFQVLLIDTNWRRVNTAKMEGLRTYYGNALAEYAHQDLDLDGIGQLLALTPNDEANSLACVHYAELFGRGRVFQYAPLSSPRDDDEHEYPAHLRGSFAFSEKASHADLSERCINGAVFKVTTAAERGTEADAELMFTESEVPLVLFRADKTLEVITDSTKVSIGDGDSILSLVSA